MLMSRVRRRWTRATEIERRRMKTSTHRRSRKPRDPKKPGERMRATSPPLNRLRRRRSMKGGKQDRRPKATSTSKGHASTSSRNGRVRVDSFGKGRSVEAQPDAKGSRNRDEQNSH